MGVHSCTGSIRQGAGADFYGTRNRFDGNSGSARFIIASELATAEPSNINTVSGRSCIGTDVHVQEYCT